jgi:hypothetical protein
MKGNWPFLEPQQWGLTRIRRKMIEDKVEVVKEEGAFLLIHFITLSSAFRNKN